MTYLAVLRAEGLPASPSSAEERRVERSRRREFEDAGRLARASEAVAAAHTGGHEGPEYKRARRAAVQASRQVYRNELDVRIAAAAAYIDAADGVLSRAPGDSPRERRRTERADARLEREMSHSLSPEQFGKWKSKHSATREAEARHRDATRAARDAAEKYRKEAKRARSNPESRKRAADAYKDCAAKVEQAQEHAQKLLVAAYAEALEASGNGTVPCTAEMATVCIGKLAGDGCGGKCKESECECSMFDVFGNEMDRETLDPIRIKAERGQSAKRQEEEAVRQAQEAAAAWQAAFRIERPPHSESAGAALLGVAQGAFALGSALGGLLKDAERPPYSDPAPPKLPTSPRVLQGQIARGGEPGTFSRIQSAPVMPLGTAPEPTVAQSCTGCVEALATIGAEGEAKDEVGTERQIDCLLRAARRVTVHGRPLTDGLDARDPDRKRLARALAQRCHDAVNGLWPFDSKGTAEPGKAEEAPPGSRGADGVPEGESGATRPSASPAGGGESNGRSAATPADAGRKTLAPGDTKDGKRTSGDSSSTGTKPGADEPRTERGPSGGVQNGQQEKGQGTVAAWPFDCALLLRTAQALGQGERADRWKKIVQLLLPVATAAGLTEELDYVWRLLHDASGVPQWRSAAEELYHRVALWCFPVAWGPPGPEYDYKKREYPYFRRGPSYRPIPPPDSKAPSTPPSWRDCDLLLYQSEPGDRHRRLVDFAKKNGIGDQDTIINGLLLGGPSRPERKDPTGGLLDSPAVMSYEDLWRLVRWWCFYYSGVADLVFRGIQRSSNFYRPQKPERPGLTAEQLVKLAAEEVFWFLVGSVVAKAGGRVLRWLGRYADESRAVARATALLARRPGVAVIGRTADDYVGLAKRIGAKFFRVPDEEWARMSRNQRWVKNRAFLDECIDSGDVFQLATRLDKMEPGTPFALEVGYLKERGYLPSSDGWQLLPPGRK